MDVLFFIVCCYCFLCAYFQRFKTEIHACSSTFPTQIHAPLGGTWVDAALYTPSSVTSTKKILNQWFLFCFLFLYRKQQSFLLSQKHWPSNLKGNYYTIMISATAAQAIDSPYPREGGISNGGDTDPPQQFPLPTLTFNGNKKCCHRCRVKHSISFCPQEGQ